LRSKLSRWPQPNPPAPLHLPTSSLTLSKIFYPQTLRFFFGLKSDVRNNVHFIDDQKILYPAGHNVVIYDMDNKSQQLIPGNAP